MLPSKPSAVASGLPLESKTANGMPPGRIGTTPAHHLPWVMRSMSTLTIKEVAAEDHGRSRACAIQS